jgi:hypothetical protein
MLIFMPFSRLAIPAPQGSKVPVYPFFFLAGRMWKLLHHNNNHLKEFKTNNENSKSDF